MNVFNEFVKLYKQYKKTGNPIELYFFLESDIIRWRLNKIFDREECLVGNIEELFIDLRSKI